MKHISRKRRRKMHRQLLRAWPPLKEPLCMRAYQMLKWMSENKMPTVWQVGHIVTEIDCLARQMRNVTS